MEEKQNKTKQKPHTHFLLFLETLSLLPSGVINRDHLSASLAPHLLHPHTLSLLSPETAGHQQGEVGRCFSQ